MMDLGFGNGIDPQIMLVKRGKMTIHLIVNFGGSQFSDICTGLWWSLINDIHDPVFLCVYDMEN